MLRNIAFASVAALALGLSTPLLAEDTNEHAQVQCPEGDGGSSGGEICICGCMESAAHGGGTHWICSPNGCGSTHGSECTQSKKASDMRKTTKKEQIQIAAVFKKLPKAALQTCLKRN